MVHVQTGHLPEVKKNLHCQAIVEALEKLFLIVQKCLTFSICQEMSGDWQDSICGSSFLRNLSSGEKCEISANLIISCIHWKDTLLQKTQFFFFFCLGQSKVELPFYHFISLLQHTGHCNLHTVRALEGNNTQYNQQSPASILGHANTNIPLSSKEIYYQK